MTRFIVLTIAGCLLWSVAFVVLGFAAGDAWQAVAGTAGRISLAIGALMAIATIALFSRRHDAEER